MATRPAFQHQGPDSNCVIDDVKLGWLSCTAYAMAMLIDANSEQRPKGCRVRRLVAPQNVEGGLTLDQVADVAEQHFDVRIQRRTPSFHGAIPVERLARRISRGWGFVLQGNNTGFVGKGSANHAIYVHEVRGGTPDEPREALIFDSQRHQPTWVPWRRVVAFGEALRPREDVAVTIPAGRVYAGFGPEPQHDGETDEDEDEMDDSDVQLRFGATALAAPDRLRADPPPGKRTNVRDTPRRLEPMHIVRTLGMGDPFVAFQKVTDGAVPPGARRGVWFGNRSGSRWVHRSGVRGVGGA
jgi:hypothetical protein